MGNLSEVVLNVSLSPPRRVVRNGRVYFVARGRSIVKDGVLCGSQGCLLYPGQEISANHEEWDGMPMTMYHPRDGQGRPCRAGEPGILEAQGIGNIYNTSISHDGHLDHDFWFDADKVRTADRRFGTQLYNKLERGEPIEISTGLFTHNEPAPPGAVNHNGKGYDAIARNYRPDHMAILPEGDRGACSVADGCGVNVVNANPDKPDCPT